ncbi:hypothetical protein VTJ83DRAFT_679 [Remersonia thermophila]|uniref:Uncharacterized protein n=1 Tax=Remersonia thermophila TaxID=72144 RepID=A0ABR4DLT2_9PEZI
MPPRAEGSHLKRGRVPGSPADEHESFKKPRRSERLSQRAANDTLKTPVQDRHHLPSPATHLASEPATEDDKEATATPPQERPSQVTRRRGDESHSQTHGFSSPPQDTQAFSQQDIDPHAPLVEGVDEVRDGVWGYLLPLDTRFVRAPVVLKKKDMAPPDEAGSGSSGRNGGSRGRNSAKSPKGGVAVSGGYIIGRHSECDVRVDDPQVSNRHCLIFTENKGEKTVAVLEDISTNGTYVNEAYLSRNDRRELEEGDEISVTSASAGFIFRYPRLRQGKKFDQQYSLRRKLGSGHFAQVFMCSERSSGECYAVKKFIKTPGGDQGTKYDGLHQEVAMLMGISHPNILFLKETFNEPEAFYVVLELAPHGELFHYISTHTKLTEAQTRKVFVQLFEGIKYLHDRNMVHRDIKPENILLMDEEDLTVKIGDFGLAKIVGEASFTTTLCGTPSYVAPEILVQGRQRRYTKAVDIWSLGVVLYICLCGFPPFSDELRSDKFPYDLIEQIRQGLYDYPSPYWDPIQDPALELIDHMLVVNPDQRYTVDQCLADGWIVNKPPGLNDSTYGLVAGVAGLAMGRRAPFRERTLLSSVNDVHVTERVPAGAGRPDVKVYTKNPAIPHQSQASPNKPREMRPDDNRDPREFIELGGKGDPELFDADDDATKHPAKDIAAEPPKEKGEAKANGKEGS